MGHEWKAGDKALLEVEVERGADKDGDARVAMVFADGYRYSVYCAASALRPLPPEPDGRRFRAKDDHGADIRSIVYRDRNHQESLICVAQPDGTWLPEDRHKFEGLRSDYIKIIPIDPPAPAEEEERLTAEQEAELVAAARQWREAYLDGQRGYLNSPAGAIARQRLFDAVAKLDREARRS